MLFRSGNDRVGNLGATAIAAALERSPHMGNLSRFDIDNFTISREMCRWVDGAWQRGENRRTSIVGLLSAVLQLYNILNHFLMDWHVFTAVTKFLP